MRSLNSPWAVTADQVSPDGSYRAVIADALELGMGAPTSGKLVIQEIGSAAIVCELESCSPAFVWSGKSDAIAIPRWTSQGDQELIVVLLPEGRTRVTPGLYRVLQLESFEDGVVRGVDSPAYMPRPVTIPVKVQQAEAELDQQSGG